MADLKISELSALAGANLVAADELAIVDDSASETKKITVSDLIANGVTVISDDTIPGAKILFAAGDIATAALADSAVTTAKVADDAVTAAKLADESTVDLVTTLPASGAFTGQLALDTDDNSLYAWDGSAWQSLKAPGSINTVSGSTTGEVNIVATTSGSTVTVSATLDDTTAAAQFLAGPTGAAGTVGYRAISGTDLPTATTSAKGGVIVNGNGLTMDSDTIEIDNTVTASSTHHVVTYNAQGLVTGGRVIASADLPIATASAVGGVIAGDGLAVDASGNLSIDNTVTSGTYTKVTVSAQGVVTAGDTLAADDIPDHSAAKLTSGTIGTSLIANDAITAAKMADQSTVLFGGALGSDNVTIFPSGDYKGQMFWDETSEDLYIYTGSAFIPITVLSGNLVNAGAYDASTNTMSSVTTAGSSAGFSAGAALPAPAASNLNHYVVVDTSGTGSGAAPAVALAPPDMLLSQGVGTEYALIDVSNAIAGQTASNISFVASGNIAATDVQAALQELDTEKLQKAGDTMTGALGIGTASSIVFEGSSADDYETTLTVTDPTADRTITLPNVTGTVVTTGDTGTVTSTMITDGTIVNADINASAEIAVSKLANGTARQLLQTDAAGTGVEFTSNVDVPGTLDVTSAGTFDSTLTVTGLISADGKVSFPAGTAAAPSLYPGSDTDTGIYSPGSDQFGITTGGTSRVVVDASGNVGIGTTSQVSSDVKLEVKDGIFAVTNSANGDARIFLGSSTSPGHAKGQIRYSLADESLEFYANSTEQMRIDSSGRLLVGQSSSPSIGSGQYAKIFVAGYAGGSPGGAIISIARDEAASAMSSGDTVGELIFSDNTGGTFAAVKCSADAAPGTSDFPGRLVFSTTADGASSPTERLRIDSSGRLLVGTTTEPNAIADTLTLAESGSGGITIRTGTTSEGNIAFSDGTSGADEYRGLIRYNHETNFLNFWTDAAERVRIDSSGNVGIGLTNISGSGSLTIVAGQSYKFAGSGGSTIYGDISADTSHNITFKNNNGLERMRIDGSGRLLVGTSTSASAGTSQYSLLQVRNNSANTGVGLISIQRNESATSITSGEPIGSLLFADNGGNEFAIIDCQADANAGSGDYPGRLVFSTTADGASSPTERLRIDANGRLTQATDTYNFTTVDAANMSISSTGNIRRSTSSLRYKTDVETMEDVYADNILNARPVWYRSTCEDDNPSYGYWGFIAEEISQIDPRLCFYSQDENGEQQVDGVAYDRFVPHLLNLIKRQGEAIAELQAEVAALKAS